MEKTNDLRKDIVSSLEGKNRIAHIVLHEPTKEEIEKFNIDGQFQTDYQHFKFELIFGGKDNVIKKSDIINIHTSDGIIAVHIIDGKLMIFSKFGELVPYQYTKRLISDTDFKLIKDE